MATTKKIGFISTHLAGTNGAEVAKANADANYELAKRYYSFGVLERHLRLLLADCFGELE